MALLLTPNDFEESLAAYIGNGGAQLLPGGLGRHAKRPQKLRIT